MVWSDAWVAKDGKQEMSGPAVRIEKKTERMESCFEAIELFGIFTPSTGLTHTLIANIPRVNLPF